jgi:hypothetical protein
MNRKHRPQQPRSPREVLAIPPAHFPGSADKDKLLQKIFQSPEALLSAPQRSGAEVRYPIPEKVTKAIAVVATNAWKAKAKMADPQSGEVRDDMKRVYRHLEAILQAFQDMGLEVKDHTDEPFDYGLPLKVVTTQPTPRITKERVVETIKPTIYWQNQIIQHGEVVIATPV